MKTRILLIAMMLISIISIAQKKPSEWSPATVTAVQEAINFDSKTDNADFVDVNVYQNDISFALNYLNGDSGWVFPAAANSLGTSAAALTANRRNYALYIVRVPTVVSKVFYCMGVQGDYTAANENTISLYSWDNGIITKLDSTANDGDMWKLVGGTAATKPFVGGPRTLQPGIYFVGYMYGNSAQVTAPSINVFGAVSTALQPRVLPATIGINKYKSAQTAMPATEDITDGAGTSYGTVVPMIILKP